MLKQILVLIFAHIYSKYLMDPLMRFREINNENSPDATIKYDNGDDEDAILERNRKLHSIDEIVHTHIREINDIFFFIIPCISTNRVAYFTSQNGSGKS